MFKSFLLPVAAVVLPVVLGLASFARPDVGGLIGGQGEPGGPIEPVKKKWECVAFCGSAGNCSASSCAMSGTNCVAVVEEASQKCVEDPNGPLESCQTVPANDFCFKRLENPCTPQNPSCTQQITGCGRKYNCQ